MFNHPYFYHATVRKMTALVGTLFNDISFERVSEDAVTTQQIRVPVHYGPREKYLARIEQAPTLDQKAAIVLPVVSFELQGMRYDAERKLSSKGKFSTRTGATDSNRFNKVWNPVPYDLLYEVAVYSNSIEDATKIVEQILPFFTPSWHVTVHMLDEAPELATDIYVNLDSVQQEDIYEGDFTRRKVVLWRLSLTVKTYFYGPVTESKVIKIATVNLHANTTASVSDTPNVVIVTTPGMLANGSPTTDATLSVDPLTIEEDDDWDYCITITENI